MAMKAEWSSKDHLKIKLTKYFKLDVTVVEYCVFSATLACTVVLLVIITFPYLRGIYSAKLLIL